MSAIPRPMGEGDHAQRGGGGLTAASVTPSTAVPAVPLPLRGRNAVPVPPLNPA